MLSLPDVTLVAIDTVAHELTRLALEECVQRVDFGDVLIYSDEPIGHGELPGRWIRTPCLRSWAEVNEIWWHWVPYDIDTSHFLTVQWDSWVLNADAWDTDWLQYDYIGAPWPWHQIYRVGNGGFSLRSRRLHHHLAGDRLLYPLAHPEDDALCRRYRPMLEAEGFHWAPESVARRFAFEHGPASQTFGYHGCFRWLEVMEAEALRAHLAPVNEYVKSTPGWARFQKVCWAQLEACIATP